MSGEFVKRRMSEQHVQGKEAFPGGQGGLKPVIGVYNQPKSLAWHNPLTQFFSEVNVHHAEACQEADPDAACLGWAPAGTEDAIGTLGAAKLHRGDFQVKRPSKAAKCQAL